MYPIVTSKEEEISLLHPNPSPFVFLPPTLFFSTPNEYDLYDISYSWNESLGCSFSYIHYRTLKIHPCSGWGGGVERGCALVVVVVCAARSEPQVQGLSEMINKCKRIWRFDVFLFFLSWRLSSVLDSCAVCRQVTSTNELPSVEPPGGGLW